MGWAPRPRAETAVPLPSLRLDGAGTIGYEGRTTRSNGNMTNDHAPALLAGRILASLIFLSSGYAKLFAAAATRSHFAEIGVPLPDIAYVLAVVIEVGGGAMLLVGLLTRPVALILAAFSVATALLSHADFASAAQQIHFLKNLCMAGGFLAFFAAGPGRWSLDHAMRR